MSPAKKKVTDEPLESPAQREDREENEAKTEKAASDRKAELKARAEAKANEPGWLKYVPADRRGFPGAPAMIDVLSQQPEVSFVVPLDFAESPGTSTQHLNVNGLVLEVPKNTELSLPRQVVDMLLDRYKIGGAAAEQMRADRDAATQDALDA